MKNGQLAIFFAFISLFLFSCGDPGHIYGKIDLNLIEYVDGTDLGGTVVKIKGKNDTATTDKEGYFTFKNVAAGKYTVTISRNNWETKETDLTVESWKVNEHNDALSYSLGMISGAVSFADYESYQKYDDSKYLSAKLVLKKGDDETVVDISSAGSFTKAEIVPGKYEASYTAEGYESHTLPVTIEKNKMLQLKMFQLVFIMGGVSGKVSDATDDTPEGFSVKVIDKISSLVVDEFLTGNDGLFAFDFIPDGEYQLRIEKEDYLAATKDVTIERKKITDAGEIEITTALNTTIDTDYEGTPAAITKETSAGISFSANIPEAVFECALDTTVWSSCTSPMEYESLSDGVHVFKVRAILDDITEETPAEYSWTVDTITPKVTIFEYPILKTILTAVEFSFEVNESPVQLKCMLDEEVFQCPEGIVQYAGLNPGEHTFVVEATDDAGNKGTSTFEWTVVSDNGWYSVETIYNSEAVCGITLEGKLLCRYGDGPFETIDGLWREVSLFSFLDEDVVVKTFCGIKFDSSLWCWGSNGGGQLGNGTVVDSDDPVKIDGMWKTAVVRAIPNSYNFFVAVCGIDYSGDLFCWGQSDTAEKLLNPTKISSVPAEMTKLHRSCYKDDTHTGNIDLLLFDKNENIYAMAKMSISGNTITLPGDDDYVFLSNQQSSLAHICGIDEAGVIYCWGNDAEGQSGGGTIAGSWKSAGTHGHIPYYIDDSVLTDKAVTVALSDAGGLYFWGHGFGNIPVKIGSENFQSLKISGRKTADVYLIDGNDSLKKMSVSGRSLVPVEIDPRFTETVAGISSGRSSSVFFSFILDNTGGLWAFGQNGATGALGKGETDTTKLVPQKIEDTWNDVSAGSLGACGIKNDGAVYCWGQELNFVLQKTPKKIGFDNDWDIIATGSNHACGLKTNGNLYCVGNNTSGQLGNGNNAASGTFVSVTTPANWKMIRTYDRHTCGIDSNDELYCWGENGSKQLGDGVTTDRNSPYKTGGIDTWLTVSAGYSHTCAIKSDKTLWCAGNDGTGVDKTVLTQIGSNSDWKSVSAGAFFTCAINDSDKLFCFGGNEQYQLGDGTTTNSSTPVAIDAATNWKEISAGNLHSCGITSGNKIKCWGKHPGFITLTTLNY